MSARFRSLSVSISEDGTSVVVDGVVEEGHIRPGMLLVIGFHPSFGMSVPISRVVRAGHGQVRLVLDCEDREGAEFVEALNFADETLTIEPSPTDS